MSELRIFSVLSLFLYATMVQAQQVKGYVRDNSDAPLPFATVQISNSDKGAVTNIDGYFSLDLDPGTYRMRIQFVGYRTRDTTIILGKNALNLSVNLRPEALTLPTAIITGDNEDPAYAIMRRTIAKAPYHANQIDRYHAKVYIKGSGRLLKIPFLFRNRIKKELAKEGIDSTVSFTQESISKLSYRRPGQYRDTVISVRTTGDDNNTSPMSFITGSFYESKVAAAVSPLASNAFSIYNFEYLGFIEDHGSIINKIKVSPKSRGDQVFEGTLYITDQLWSIHSLDLVTSIWGIQFAVKQVYAPVKDDIWMPIDQIFDVGGNVFGFGFEYKYLAHLSDYSVIPNPEISVPLVVLDDKKDKEESITANAKITKLPNPPAILDLKPGQELSAKQLRKMMKEYKKKELDSIPETENINFNTNESKQVIDSNAAKRDSLFWAEVRPVALTEHEIKGYSRFDSLAHVEKVKSAKEDSSRLTITAGENGVGMQIEKARSGFKLSHLLTGGRYNFNDKKNYFSIQPTLTSINYNTVEGYHFDFGLKFGNNTNKLTKYLWSINPKLGYAFAREKINYSMNLSFSNVKSKDQKKFVPWNLNFSAGDRPYSFNPALERGDYLNSIYSLLFSKNYLKLYSKKYVGSSFFIQPGKSISILSSFEFQDRDPLENNVNERIKRPYSPNFPPNAEITSTNIESNRALIFQSSISWTPFFNYVVSNGFKQKDRSGSPKFTMVYRAGLGLDSKFHYLQLNTRKHFNIGAGDDWDLDLGYGFYLQKPEYFQDFTHFNGNQYIFSPTDPIKYFRALNYYSNSTNGSSFTVMSNYQFRKFILTTIPYFRKKGIRENIILNDLWTNDHANYSELGYSINYLLRIFRLEAISTWQDQKFQKMYYRFGIATGFNQLFKF